MSAHFPFQPAEAGQRSGGSAAADAQDPEPGPMADPEPTAKPFRRPPPAQGRRLSKPPEAPASALTPEQRLLILDTWQRSGLQTALRQRSHLSLVTAALATVLRFDGFPFTLVGLSGDLLAAAERVVAAAARRASTLGSIHPCRLL